MHRLKMAGLIAGFAGCMHGATPTGVGTSDAALRCPDPSSCTESNGTGVYTAENGRAGIGPSELMITHFINQGSSVQFQGRYRSDPTSQTGPAHWRLLSEPGQVLRADYQGRTSLQVVSVAEAATVPTWTLRDPSGQQSVPVTGDQLHQLTLYVRFSTVQDGSQDFVIDFDGAAIDHSNIRGRPETDYHMRWGAAGAAATQTYCFDASGIADSVVYQESIDVEPVTGKVTHSSTPTSVVTLSCFLGAPATVYRWGYSYAERDPYHLGADLLQPRKPDRFRELGGEESIRIDRLRVACMT